MKARKRWRERQMRGSARRFGIALEERGAKAVLLTGLIIAYGINSLATTLAASTYHLRPCCLLAWEFWKRRIVLKMADMSASMASQGRKQF
jgi:hypothetical protein